MNFEAYDMKAELGFKKKINELLRRESSTPHIMETLTTSIGIIERSLCSSFISLAVNLNGLQALLQRPFQGNSAMRLANLSKLYFGCETNLE